VPLKLLYPEADIPVVQLSIQSRQGPEHHLKVGEALRPLAEEGVLVVGSGALTHNLHEFFRGGYAADAPAPDWVSAFGEWMRERIEAGERDDLVHYRSRAPHGAANHPTESTCCRSSWRSAPRARVGASASTPAANTAC
jgi:4,5-DOPA dioxygenase extradiol